MALMMTACRNLKSFSLDPYLVADDAAALISRLPPSLTYLQLTVHQDVLSCSCWKAHSSLLHLDLETSRTDPCSASSLVFLTALTGLTLRKCRFESKTLKLPSLSSIYLHEGSGLEGDPCADLPKLQELTVVDMALPTWASKLSNLAIEDSQQDPDDRRRSTSNALQNLPPSGWKVKQLTLNICWTGGIIQVADLLLLKDLRKLRIDQHEPPDGYDDPHGHDVTPIDIMGNAADFKALDKQLTLRHDDSIILHEIGPSAADTIAPSQ